MSAAGCRECRSEEKKEAALTNVVVLVVVKVWRTWLGDKELWHATASGTSFRLKGDSAESREERCHGPLHFRHVRRHNASLM